MTHFKGKQFKKDIITVAVGYCLRYNLSYREISEIMADRRSPCLSYDCLWLLCQESEQKNKNEWLCEC